MTHAHIVKDKNPLTSALIAHFVLFNSAEAKDFAEWPEQKNTGPTDTEIRPMNYTSNYKGRSVCKGLSLLIILTIGFYI